MLIGLQNAMMGMYDSEVEYLESSGDPSNSTYILTDIKPAASLSFKIRGALLENSFNKPYTSFFGSRNSPSGGSGGICSWWNTSTFYLYGYNTIWTKSAVSSYGTFYDFEIGPNAIKRDNEFWGSLSNPIVTDTEVDIAIFSIAYYSALMGITVDSRVWKTRIAIFQIFDNGVIVRDFIPVRFTNSSGKVEGAMFDRVSGRLFMNQGNGAFVIGPDK